MILPSSVLCLRRSNNHRALLFTRYMSRLARQPQKQPARLVLSSKVAEPKKLRQKKADTPPAALNQRHASIRPQRLIREKDSVQGKAQDRKKLKTEFKQMKMAQSLSTVSRTARTISGEKIQSRSSFDEFNLLETIKEAIRADALSDLETVQPTPVQKLVIPVLLQADEDKRKAHAGEMKPYLIAAETGSGKTLAYVLPVIDHIKRAEDAQRLEEECLWTSSNVDPFDLEIPTLESEEGYGRPRAVILVPTSELVSQVGALLKSLSHRVKFRAVQISRDYSPKVLRNRLASQVDIVVATPHLLGSLTAKSPGTFSRCSHIVVDEADSLFDRSFSPITSAIIGRANNLERLILCSATIPRSLDTRLRIIYPEVKRLVTPNLHAIPRRVQLSLVDIDADPYRGNRNLACADTLYTIAKEDSEGSYVKKVVVFVNEREAAAEVAQYLRSKGLDAVEYARDTVGRAASSVLDQFTGPKQEADPGTDGKQRVKILVTTDIASRGVDTKTVKNVILYDVPYSTIDFIHRLGRTGRMGRRGKAVILVDKNTNKGWVADIRRSMYMGGPLV